MSKQNQWLFETPIGSGDYMAKQGRWDWRKNDNSLPGVERVGVSRGNTPRNNQDQNRQIERLAKKYGLTYEQIEKLHDRITGQLYGYQEIEEIIKSGDYFLADVEKPGTELWLFETPFAQMEAEDVSIEQFGPFIKLDIAPTHPDVVKAKTGLYAVFRDRAFIYVGESGNLSERMRYHRLCLTHFKLPTVNYQVRILPLPGSTKASRKRREQILRDSHPRALGHLRPTSESEYFL